MQIRSATNNDKAAIINLLHQSTIPSSPELWSWKHEQNPFGASSVLLAEENNELTGLCAFMYWGWRWNGQRYKAIRAVDAATHPAHQGKGIFKKLILQQVAQCKEQGARFVFNTLQEQSHPGYLKMGWQHQGRMPLKITWQQPFSLAFNKLFNKSGFTGRTDDPTPVQEWTPALLNLVNQYTTRTDQFSTVLSPAYIQWRYAHYPLCRYNYFTDHSNYILIGRIRYHAFTKELQLVDFIILHPKADPHKIERAIKKEVRSYCAAHQVGFISFSGQQYHFYHRYFKWMGLLPVRSTGPLVTLFDLNMNTRFNELLNINNWCYSLGDLELFQA